MSDPGSEYAGLSWQQIQEDIMSGNPGSLSAAATVFSGIQQGLSSIAETVNAALGTLTGGSGSTGWQGPAAQAFVTATGSLVSGIQSLGEVLQSSGGGSVADLLTDNGSKLSWAQNQIQSISGEFAAAAAQAGASVSQSGLVSPPTSMSEKITAEMLAVLEQLAQDYDQTITALHSQIPTSGALGSGTDSDGSSNTSSGSGSGSGSANGTGPNEGSPNTTSGAPSYQAAFALSGKGSNTGSNNSDTSDDSSTDSNNSSSSNSPNSSNSSDGSDTSGSPNPPTVSTTVTGATSAPPADSSSSGGSGDGVDGWISSAFSVLEANGVPASQLSSSDVNLIIQHESGGNPSAVNNWDSNAAAGDPSQGLMQTTGQTFNAYALPGYNSNILDPVSNIVAGVRYALATYGSLNNVPGVVAVDSGGSYVGY